MLKRNQELKFNKNELEAAAARLAEQNSSDLPWFEADLLNRGEHIRAITDLLLTTEGKFVMTTSSPWGTGKTTFLRMWKAYLEYLGHPCVLFNAWENDYVDNPFLSFISEMGSQLAQMQSTPGKVKKNFEKIWDLGKKLAVPTLSIGTRLFLGTAIDCSGLIDPKDKEGRELADQVIGALGTTGAAYAEELLTQQVTTKRVVTDFKKAVRQFVKTQTKGEKKPPMFFFVDELDRCKPTYSIELLEVIKHLFDIDGIIFVLSLDREQLCHSVRAAYGDGIDAVGYLRRFIDLEYRIPKPQKKEFVRSLVNTYGVKDYRAFKSVSQDVMEKFIIEFARLGDAYSLRLIEKAFLRGTVLLRGLDEVEYKIVPILFVPFIYLRELNERMFDKMIRGHPVSTLSPKDGEEIINHLGASKLSIPAKMKKNYITGNVYTVTRGQISSDIDISNYVYYYERSTGEHLVDVIKRYLDLSESLVPIEQIDIDTQ
ncbi:KAP family P-loop NTPase fold protein [Desulfovibrio caledoniensis]